MKIEEILSEENKTIRENKYNEIVQLIRKNTMAVFLVHKTIESTFHPSIQGLEFNGRGNIDFKKDMKKTGKPIKK